VSRRAAIRLAPTGSLITAIVLAALAIGSIAAPALATAPATTAGCTWKQHSKRVAKRVRRHGQWRRVKRVKHWWTCEAVPTPSALTSQPTLPFSPTPEPTQTEPEVEVGHLGVKAVEYSYTLSRSEVSSGEVIVELNNQGEDPHNLVLEHEGTEDPKLEIPSTPSLSQANSRLTLSPGTYRLYCSLYKHEAKGMEATLVVGGG
jgi:plastocyanin